jgi:hypothetical protein
LFVVDSLVASEFFIMQLLAMGRGVPVRPFKVFTVRAPNPPIADE